MGVLCTVRALFDDVSIMGFLLIRPRLSALEVALTYSYITASAVLGSLVFRCYHGQRYTVVII